MTKEELAALINGRKYRHELTDKEEKAAKDARLVVVFGASDDRSPKDRPPANSGRELQG